MLLCGPWCHTALESISQCYCVDLGVTLHSRVSANAIVWTLVSHCTREYQPMLLCGPWCHTALESISQCYCVDLGVTLHSRVSANAIVWTLVSHCTREYQPMLLCGPWCHTALESISQCYCVDLGVTLHSRVSANAIVWTLVSHCTREYQPMLLWTKYHVKRACDNLCSLICSHNVDIAVLLDESPTVSHTSTMVVYLRVSSHSFPGRQADYCHYFPIRTFGIG